jgi:hypothetical protein
MRGKRRSKPECGDDQQSSGRQQWLSIRDLRPTEGTVGDL